MYKHKIHQTYHPNFAVYSWVKVYSEESLTWTALVMKVPASPTMFFKLSILSLGSALVQLWFQPLIW